MRPRLFKRSLLFLLLLCTIALGLLIHNWNQYWAQEKDFIQHDIEIKAGESGQEVINKLIAVGLLNNKPLYIKLWLRFGVDNQQFKQGYYRFEGPYLQKQILDQLLQGKVHYFQLTIIPGWSYRQAIELIHSNPYLVQDIPVHLKQDESSTLQNEEGWFFPDTYLFTYHSKASELLKRGKTLMQKKLEEVWSKRQPNDFIETPSQLLTLASIVEKETAIKQEKKHIAGVFLNRLKKKMRLQTDPTVIYGMGAEFDGNLRRKDLTKDTDYNTYTRFGLPPTPIALPDLESLESVANPQQTSDLYFVADGRGGHVFSETLEQHNSNVRKFILNKSYH